MEQKRSNKKRYNFLIDADVYEDFSLLCEELGLVRSKNIENNMKKFIEEHKELLKKLKKNE
ncbi:hypothetical protein KY332_02530 [Candidatus Woesearchaeota archaeon]|nr:hypothetical protein [Candidatus Woesearchaeota archaeon]